MKKRRITATVLLLILIGLFTQTAFANTTLPDSCSYQGNKYEVQTNGFWSNCFVSAGAGGMIYFGDNDKQMDFNDRLSPALDIAVGKWFTPSIGVRLVYSGLQIKGLTKNGSHSTGNIYTKAHDGSHNLYNEKFDFFNVHGDVLFNLMNLLGGYNEKRFYSISPYVGVGWARVWQSPERRESTLNLGLYNSFRLSSSLDLTLDVHGMVCKDDFDGELGGREEEGALSATVGLTYKLPHRIWKKPMPSNPNLKYTEQDEKEIREKLNVLVYENQRLIATKAESQSVRIEIDTVHICKLSPTILIFPIGKATLSSAMRVNLDFFAQQLKSMKNKSVYVITGYADDKTGSKEANEQLSQKRAQVVYGCLIKEFGISDSQLQIDYKGGVENLFYNNPELSRATIIKIKE